MMYYLWRTPDGIFYVTDYKEQKNGLTNIDGRGYIDVKEICCSKFKFMLWETAMQIELNENKKE